MKHFLFYMMVLFLFSCSKNLIKANQLPSCLRNIITNTTSQSGVSPASVTKYDYKGKTVYYMVSPCCDQYNIVYDKDCKVLGYPDGGITGGGDGSLTDFRDSAKNGVVIWKNN